MGGGPPAGDADAWAAEWRAGEAARGRARLRSLRRQAAEDATWAGTLVDLCERGAPVAVATGAGRVHRGRLMFVGADCCAVARADGGGVMVAFAAVAWVRPEDGAVAGAGRRGPDDVTLAEVLARLADDDADVVVTTTGGATVAGRLRSVGQDVLAVVEGAGGRRAPAYVRLASVAEVSWRLSG